MSASTIEGIRAAPSRTRAAGVELSYTVVCIFCVFLMVVVISLLAVVMRQRTPINAAVIDENGETKLVSIDQLDRGTRNVEIASLATKAIKFIVTATPDNVEEYYALASEEMSPDMAAEFFATIASPESVAALKAADPSGASRNVYREMVRDPLRTLEPADLPANFKFPDRLVPGINPRFDVVVSGRIQTRDRATREVIKNIPAEPFAYWVRVQELDQRVERWPRALMVDWFAQLKYRAPVVKEGGQ